MKGQSGCGHLTGFVHQKDSHLLVHAAWRISDLRCDPVRTAAHKPPDEGEGVYADVPERSACQPGIEETVRHVIFLEAAEIHLNHAELSQAPVFHKLTEPFVQRHVIDGHGLRQNQSPFFCQSLCRCQITDIQRDGLFAQNVLSMAERLVNVAAVSVVGRGDVDDIHIFIGENV